MQPLVRESELEMTSTHQCFRRRHAGANLIALLPIVATLISCGAPTPHAERLNGSWQIVGDPTVSTDPAISIVLDGKGGQITGTMVAVVQCSNEPTTRRMMTLLLNGQVNQDNPQSFTVASETDAYGDVLNLSGSIPRSGQQVWNGTYSLYAPLSDPASGAISCLLKPSASFQATAMTPLSGAYSGSITGNHLSPDASISLQIAESPTLSGLAGYGATASLSLTGASCFKAGTQISANTSTISGDSITLQFIMDDGSETDFYGLTNAGASQIAGILAVEGGKCLYDVDSGLLVRQ